MKNKTRYRHKSKNLDITKKRNQTFHFMAFWDGEIFNLEFKKLILREIKKRQRKKKRDREREIERDTKIEREGGREGEK